MLLHETLCSDFQSGSKIWLKLDWSAILVKILVSMNVYRSHQKGSFSKQKLLLYFMIFLNIFLVLDLHSHWRIIMLIKMIFSTKIWIKLMCWYLPGTDKNAVFLLTHTLLVCCLLHHRWNKNTSYHKKRIWCYQTKSGHLQGGKWGEPSTFSEKHSYRPDRKFQHTKLCF